MSRTIETLISEFHSYPEDIRKDLHLMAHSQGVSIDSILVQLEDQATRAYFFKQQGLKISPVLEAV